MPLSEPLESGATIEIVTSPTGRPSPSWLNWVVTARARTHIRHFLKDQRREDSLALGRNLLDRALMAHGSRLNAIEDDTMQAALSALGKADIETLLVDVALGNTLPILPSPTSPAPVTTLPWAARRPHWASVAPRAWASPMPNAVARAGDAIQGYLGQEKGLWCIGIAVATC